MFYIVALGNPGKEYSGTRHNVGWEVADAVRDRFHFPLPHFSAKYQGRVSQGRIGECEVTMLYPDTFMNNSGSAVVKLVPPKEANRLIVLHDETAIMIGHFKLSVGRGDGGHNGVRSIIDSLGTKDFVRLRIGIAARSFLTGRPKLVSGDKLSKFVLGSFTKREQEEIAKLTEDISEAIRITLNHGPQSAMNRYNVSE
jgi:peptidyl-tRNA hydrolase, PTH1 family